MKPSVRANLLYAILVATLSAGAGLFAFNNHCSLEPAARSAISALSIIFGLSTAVSTLLSAREGRPEGSFGDPSVEKSVKRDFETGQRQARHRQAWLNVAALLSIIAGLIYLVLLDSHQATPAPQAAAVIFAVLSSATLLFTLRMPGLMLRIAERNEFFERRRDKLDRQHLTSRPPS